MPNKIDDRISVAPQIRPEDVPALAAAGAASNSVARTEATAMAPLISVTPTTLPAHMGRLTRRTEPSRATTAEMSLAMPASSKAAARGSTSLPTDVAVPITTRAPRSLARPAMTGAQASAVAAANEASLATNTSP